jgi:hypothetical protein
MMTAATMANAATLGVISHDYGSNPGNVDPGGNDTLAADHVTVSDGSSSRFFDSFVLSAFAGDIITEFQLTLDFGSAGPFGFLGSTENWSVRVQGSDSGGALDDMFRPLFDIASPQTGGLSSSTLFAGDTFAHSVASGEYEFWFSEFSFRRDDFQLNSATLTVIGEPAAVPLPASFPLLLAGLGGVAALRRNRKAA